MKDRKMEEHFAPWNGEDLEGESLVPEPLQ